MANIVTMQLIAGRTKKAMPKVRRKNSTESVIIVEQKGVEKCTDGRMREKINKESEKSNMAEDNEEPVLMATS